MTDDLKIHPLCAALRGEDLGHDVDELSAIQASMTEHGPIKGRIIVDADTGQVLDGATFMQAWKKVASTVPGFAERYPLASYIQVREFSSEEEKVALVVGMQLGRRNLEPGRRLAAVARLVGTTTNGGPGRSKNEKAIAVTDRILGRYASVSGGMIQAWKRVERRGVPELKQAVETGQVSVKAAADVSALSTGEQRNVVAAGPYAIKKIAKRIREDRARKRKAREELLEATGKGVEKFTTPGIPVEVLDALDTVSRWWNEKGRRIRERGEAIRAAVLVAPAEAWWHADSQQGRKAFVAAHWNELLGIRNKAIGKSNGTEAFDKLSAMSCLERMKRNQPNDQDVAAVAQWFEMMVDRL